MKSFDEFVATISDEELGDMYNNSIPLTKELKEAFPSNSPFTSNSAAITYSVTFALLRRYHEWLSEQLDQNV